MEEVSFASVLKKERDSVLAPSRSLFEAIFNENGKTVLSENDKMDGSTVKRIGMMKHHTKMNELHEKTTNYHLAEAKKAEDKGDFETKAFHESQIAHHQDQAADHREKKSNLLLKMHLKESFEVYSVKDNGSRSTIPTTDAAGKSKYDDAASAEMQKIKLEKQSPGKHWVVVSIKD